MLACRKCVFAVVCTRFCKGHACVMRVQKTVCIYWGWRVGDELLWMETAWLACTVSALRCSWVEVSGP